MAIATTCMPFSTMGVPLTIFGICFLPHSRHVWTSDAVATAASVAGVDGLVLAPIGTTADFDFSLAALEQPLTVAVAHAIATSTTATCMRRVFTFVLPSPMTTFQK